MTPRHEEEKEKLSYPYCDDHKMSQCNIEGLKKEVDTINETRARIWLAIKECLPNKVFYVFLTILVAVMAGMIALQLDTRDKLIRMDERMAIIMGCYHDSIKQPLSPHVDKGVVR